MKRIQQRQGDLHRSGLRVGQLRPTILGVGLDGRVVFGEGEFEAHVGVYMAVRDMVHDLAHGPAVGAVGSVKLFFRKPFHRSAHIGRGVCDLVETHLPLFVGEGAMVVELADGVAQVGHCVLWHGESATYR